MKKAQLLFAVVFTFFILFMVIKESRRKANLHEENINGEIISFEKGLRGYYDIKFVQSGKLRQIGVIPVDGKLNIHVGDSIYKNSNTDIFYIKGKGMDSFQKPDWKDVHISGNWEE